MSIAPFLNGRDRYSADDVLDYLLEGINESAVA
jgi:hypothetical protein